MDPSRKPNQTTWDGEYKRETSMRTPSCICVPDTTRESESKSPFKCDCCRSCFPLHLDSEVMSHNHSLPCAAHLRVLTNTPLPLYHHRRQLASTYASRSELLPPVPSPWLWPHMNMSSSKPSTLSTDTARRASRPPSSACQPLVKLLTRLWDGIVALLLASAAQFLIAGIERLLEDNSAAFPASILAMAVVFCLIWISGLVVSGVDEFYERHLRCAADLLNRHMSIGFTIPFIMIFRNPLADVQTIGLIIGCFVITGLVNSFSAYFLALPIQYLVVCWDRRVGDCGSSDGDAPETRQSKDFRLSANSCDSKFLDPSLRDGQSTPGDETTKESQASTEISQNYVTSTRRSALCNWLLHNPLLLVFWLLTITVGIPLRYTVGHDTTLGICIMFSSWLTSLAVQGAIKTHQTFRPWLRTLLSGISNAVLWTSLAMVVYVFADAAISDRPVHDMLSNLQTGTPVSQIIAHLDTAPLPPSLAAGDIALSILNAGLVAWGLKLYEYRRQLLSRAGLTVFLVSSLLALGNVAIGPLFAHTVGLRPAGRDIAFAARGVTIALANPVMVILNGDQGLNAAMVVVSGIMYQMGLGFGVGAWLEKRLRWNLEGKRQPSPDFNNTQEVPTNNHGTATTTGTGLRDLEAQVPELPADTRPPNRRNVHDPRTVAAGVTIGINSAAMGTAYLYETKSDAAPYSALSMIALGIMTVGFATIKPIAGWVVDSVATP